MGPLTFNRWAELVENKYVDIDGSYGGQCWDTFADYCISVLGIDPINTWGGDWSGWAYAIWDQFDTNGASKYFYKVAPTEPAQQGDTVIWEVETDYYPASHIAVAVADAGNNVLCISQNSSAAQPWLPGYSTDATGPNIRQYLTKIGLAGYLRPIGNRGSAIVLGEIVDEPQEGFLMALSPEEQADIYWILCKPDGREHLTNMIAEKLMTKLVTKADAAWQNQVASDQSNALGRIETKLGSKLDKDDGHSLRLAITSISKGDPATMAKAVVEAMGAELSKEVVRELGDAITRANK